MKSDNNQLDLKRLLADVEHAGRDARRRQELSDMIDRMAGVPSAEPTATVQEVPSAEPTATVQEVPSAKPTATVHGVWWWTVRVAAAACLFFFIVTAVRIWFIPTGQDEAPLVAEAVVPDEPLSPAEPATTLTAPVAPAALRRPMTKSLMEKPEEPVAEEVYVAEEVHVVEDSIGEPTIIETAPEPEAIAQATEEQAPVAADSTALVIPAEPAKPTRRSLLGALFRRAEPSKMDGTMLALNIF